MVRVTSILSSRSSNRDWPETHVSIWTGGALGREGSAGSNPLEIVSLGMKEGIDIYSARCGKADRLQTVFGGRAL